MTSKGKKNKDKVPQLDIGAQDKGGRPRLWNSAVELQADIDEYFDWCKDNPFIKVEFNGKDAIECKVPIERPPTIEGLAVHLGTNRATLLNYQKKKGFEEFFYTIKRAKEKINADKVSGAVAGVYNVNAVKFDLTNNTRGKEKYTDSKALDMGGMDTIKKINFNVVPPKDIEALKPKEEDPEPNTDEEE